MKKTRNGEIDFLRFIFMLIVVLRHLTEEICPQGNISVEFFFTLSGFLMARHAERITENCTMNLDRIADETWLFLRGKVASFYRYYLMSYFLVVLYNCLLLHNGLMTIIKNLFGSIPTLSLTFFALNYDTASFYAGATWYLSAMLIAMLILYPILLRNYRFAIKIIFPLIAIFILGYEQAVTGTIHYWKEWAGITRFGILRAVSEISFGATLFHFASLITQNQSLLNKSNRLFIKCIFTSVKLTCYLVVIVFSHKYFFGMKLDREYQLHCLILCGVGIIMSFCDIGYCIPDSKLTRYLGKISVPVFVFHKTVNNILVELLKLNSISTTFSLLKVAVCIIISILLMYLTDYLSAQLKKVLISFKTKDAVIEGSDHQ